MLLQNSTKLVSVAIVVAGRAEQRKMENGKMCKKWHIA